ncbi:MAG: DUF1841 family protein [Candidatus Competibacteraceae bacterium]|nr:DUF1841 family protein [Candidatus Competibacteraceae bacterium]
MFGNDRDSLRRYYYTVWEKAGAGQALEPLEQLIVGVIREHPEYQAVLTNAETVLNREYLPEGGQTNPFLHMGMHIAIQEQLSGNRPVGILDIYQRLCQRLGDAHTAEHAMMECLGETLWEAQRNGREPDEQVYLERLRRLI